MKIRNSYSRTSDKEPFEVGSDSIDIIAEDGRPLFTIRLTEDGGLRIDSGMICRHKGVGYDDSLVITPVSSNVIQLNKPVYKFPNQG
jgi:hypothetical protein